MTINHSDFSFDGCKQDQAKIPISIGFSLVLMLILALVIVSLSYLKKINMSLSTLVEETNIKLQSANSMRDAIRLRADSFKKMRLMKDPFLRDEELMKFYHYSGKFRQARESLVQVPMNSQEKDILDKLIKTIQQAQPINDQVAEIFATTGAIDRNLHARAKRLQFLLLKFLDALVIIENQSARQALFQTNKFYLSTQYSLFSIAFIVLLIVITIAVVVIRLVTNRNKLVSHQAMHDPLTNLYNRNFFEYHLENLLSKGLLNKQQHALLYMDLDQFKVVNDTCGHVAGDQLLKQISTLLKSKIRQQDTFARLGGDEFGLLLNNCDSGQAVKIAEQLSNIVNEYRFCWDNKIFSVGISIGIALITRQMMALKDVLIAADTACFAAKDAGRNTIHLYLPEDKYMSEYEGQIQWLPELSAALVDDRFVLFAQPVYQLSNASASGDTVKGYEILVRYQDQKGKLYQPGAFLPAAERYGHMIDIDLWVIKHSFAYIEASPRHQSAALFFSFNISAASIASKDFKKNLHDLFEQYNIPAQIIAFEITEMSAMSCFDRVIDFINDFRQQGCIFSLDDFGNGISSFSYLKQLAVDQVKITANSIAHINEQAIDYAVVKAINEIAHLHGKKTLAKGVENLSVRDKLVEMGVDYAQGYALSKPIKLMDI